MAETLDEVLTDEETKETSTEETKETESKVEEAETESKKETEKAEDETTTSKDTQEPESWTKAAALDERHKRQEAEKEIKELKTQLEDRKSEKKPTPDVFEDQAAFVESLKSEFSQALLVGITSLSRDMAMDKYDDYEEKEIIFHELAKDDPTLITKLSASANPARFAYNTAKNHLKWKEVEEMGRDGYEAKLEKELRAKIAKEDKEKQEESQKRDEKVSSAEMPSLASKGSSTTKDSGGSEELGDILGR